jgi:hypothetical protein
MAPAAAQIRVLTAVAWARYLRALMIDQAAAGRSSDRMRRT